MEKKLRELTLFLALYGYTWGFAGFLPVQATLTLRIRKGANLDFSGQYTVPLEKPNTKGELSQYIIN